MDNDETIETISNEIIDNGEVDEVTRAAQLEAAKAANKPTAFTADHLVSGAIFPDATDRASPFWWVVREASAPLFQS